MLSSCDSNGRKVKSRIEKRDIVHAKHAFFLIACYSYNFTYNIFVSKQRIHFVVAGETKVRLADHVVVV